jgi:tetratricopeptide (TPR) repeat protein
MGIVHRDVKPSNLLVDASGHLWITDFGLAQILAPSPVAGEGWGEGGCLTMTGDLLGTLRYMSPEQAAGRSRVLDHRTDVYSLGVSLYELLALRPPFSGDDRQEVLRQISDDEPPSPRRLNRAIPRDLETIVLKAMAKEPQARYAAAQALADDLKRFLADEPVRARRPTVAERVAKWSRRHRAVVWAAVLLLIVAAVASTASTVIVLQAKRQTASALHDAEVEAARANEVVHFLQQMLSSASPYGPQGKDLTVRQMLDQFSLGIGDRLEGQPEVEATVRAVLGKTYAQLLAQDEADVHLRAAIDLYRAGAGGEAKLADCLTDYAWNHRAHDEAVAAAREAVSICRRLGDSKALLRALWAFHNRTRGTLDEKGEVDRAFDEAASIVRQDPSADCWEFACIVHNEGALKRMRGELDEAEALGRDAVARHRRVSGQDHPELAWALHHLGLTLEAKKDLAGAEASLREAMAIFSKRYGHHATVDMVRDELAKVLEARGDRGALDQLRSKSGERPAGEEDVIGRLNRLIAIDPRPADALIRRTGAYRERGELDKALADCNEAIRLDPNLGKAFAERGAVHYRLGDLDAALADHGEAVRLDPKNASSHLGRSHIYHMKGLLDEALADCNEGIRLAPNWGRGYLERASIYTDRKEWEKALADFNETMRLAPNEPPLFFARGRYYRARGERDKALADLDEAIRLDPGYLWHYPERAELYRDAGEFDKALADHNEAFRIVRARPEEAVRLTPDVCWLYDGRAATYRAKGDLDKALADHNEAIRLRPKVGLLYARRAATYRAKGDSEKALADYDEALRVDPNQPRVLYERGVHYRSLGKRDKAFADFGEAIRIDPRYPWSYDARAETYRQAGDFDKAIADYGEAIQLSPNSSFLYERRAATFRAKGDHDKALADYTEAIRLQPDNAGVHVRRAEAFTAVGEFDKAIADYTEALRLAPRGPSAIEAEHKRAECANLLLFDKTLAARAQATLSRAMKLYFEDHKLAEAMSQFDDAIKTSREMLAKLPAAPAGPPVPPSCNVLARSLAWRAHVVRVEKKDADQAIADCTEAIRCDPQCAVAHRHRGVAYSVKGDSDKAMADFDAAVRLDPKDRTNLTDRAREEMIRREFEKAATDYDRAVEIEPLSWHLYKRRAVVHFQLKNYDKALADIAKAVELEAGDNSNLWWIPPDQVAKCPDDRLRKGLLELADKTVQWAEGTTDASRATSRHGWKTAAGAYLARAGLYGAFGQRDTAVADFTKAIQLEPQNADVWTSRTRFYLEQRDWDSAIADLGKVVELKPEQANFWYQRALVRLAAGRAEDYRKDCAEMLQRFGKADKPDDTHWAAWTCALTPDTTSDWPQAVGLAEKAAKSDSKSISYANTWGAVLYRAGRFDEALVRLSEADALAQQPSEALKSSPAYTWFFLAMAHHRLGDRDEAKLWLDKAVAWTDKAEREADEGTADLPWNRRLTLKLLRAEAAALLGDPDKPPAEKKREGNHHGGTENTGMKPE